jgi:methyl-accepting chemotaxis protein
VQDLKAQIARVRTREFSTSFPPIRQMDQYDKVIANDLVDLGKMQDTYEVDRHARGKSAVQRVPGHVGPPWPKTPRSAPPSRRRRCQALIRGESNKLIVALRGHRQLVKLYGDGGDAASDRGDALYASARFWIITLRSARSCWRGCATLITRWLVQPRRRAGLRGCDCRQDRRRRPEWPSIPGR